MPRWLAHLLVVCGWLLTPVLAWGASYMGLWAGALVAMRFSQPFTMLGVAAAGAAGMGLWGGIVFTVVDIVFLRPFKAYPWTWDAIGGGSTWWYLPIWWMFGTFLAWMGGTLVARAPEGASLARTAAPVLIGAVVIAVVARLAGIDATLPVTAGAGFAVTLPVLAVVALARRA